LLKQRLVKGQSKTFRAFVMDRPTETENGWYSGIDKAVSDSEKVVL
jgi:hypothetical protein